jgi:CheY-like chemotaxis protein
MRRTTQAPDIIFLDLNMPEVDGFSFLKNFKDLARIWLKPSPKLWCLPAQTAPKDRSQAFTFPTLFSS